MERKPDRNSKRKAREGSAEDYVNIADSPECGTPDSHIPLWTVNNCEIHWQEPFHYPRLAGPQQGQQPKIVTNYPFISGIRDLNCAVKGQIPW